MTEHLTEQHVRALLAVAMGYDNRRPGDLNVAAWSEAADRGRWTFDEAREAIHAHYRDSTDFVMPAHITHRVRTGRQDAAMREQHAAALTGPPPADPQHVADVMTELANRMGWTRDLAARDAIENDRCPGCGVPPGQRCQRPTRKGPVETRTHPSRLDLARARMQNTPGNPPDSPAAARTAVRR